MIKNLSLILLLFACFSSCVEKFWPQVDKYQDVLVVDGLLTNDDDVIVINLSLSSSINEGILIPVSKGIVNIVENGINTYSFTESEPGIYVADDESFRGVIGNSYQLFIDISTGGSYESEVCFLAAPTPIDSVYGEQESHEVTSLNRLERGIQFYLDNHSDQQDTCYYLWRLHRTFKYKSSFNIDYFWAGAFFPYPKPDSLRTCWHESQIPEIFTFSTENIENQIIERLPLNYASTDTKDLSIRYSLLVSQLSISKDAFNFWDALRQQNIDVSNLYSRQPIQLRGNVRNITNSDEPVLGYFTVAGVTKKRIYLNRPTLPFYYIICEPDYKSMGWIQYETEEFWPIYLTESPSGALGMGTQDLCFDCRMEDGSLTPPDYWEN